MNLKVTCLIAILAASRNPSHFSRVAEAPLIPGDELVGAGADRSGRVGRGALFVDDHGGVEAEVIERLEARVLERQRNRRGSLASIDWIEAKERFLLVGRVLAGGALEREFDVLGAERLVVLELDPLAQRESQRLEVG